MFIYDLTIHIDKQTKTFNTMKALRFIPLIALMALVGCSTNRQMAKDDTYYSPYGNTGGQMTKGNGSYVSPSISSNSEYDYQAYYSDSKNYVNNADPVYQTTETVTDTNGVVYTTTETYYDADFATRIKRFGTQASSTRDYYDDYYTYGSGGDTYVYVNSYDPFYWDYYPTYYYGWSYRPYWSSYWSWNWYWGYPYYYYSYWGWDPYWAYGWGYHHHYWHHPHHHHFHGDWYHGGGHHNNGFGGGGSSFSSYVASVRHGNSTGSMSHTLPSGGDRSGSMSSRPQSSSINSALARVGGSSSSTRRPTMSSRPTVGSGATPQRPVKKEAVRPGSQSGNYTSPNSSRPSRSSSEYVRPQSSSSSRPSSSADSSRRSSSSSYNRSSSSSSRSSASPSRSSSSSSSRSSGSSYGGGSRGSSSSSSSHSSSSSSHSSSSSGSRGGGGGGGRR